MEEWRYGPSPTDSIPTDFLQALKEDKLLPVASLDEGFIRPTYANQIMISYLQAGLMCLFIADQFENGLVGMLQAYRRGAKTPEAIEQALGVTPDELDEQFGDYLDGRFGPVVKQLDVFTESLSNANIGIAEERWEDARIQAEQAMRSYPDYTGPNNPYLILARIFQTLSQPEKANSTLQEYWRLGGRDTSALGKLAGIYFADNNVTEAVAVQRVLSRAQPLDIKHHITLGEWLLATNHHSGALREFQAALALSPHDKANIHFKLASALHALERTTEARRELLYALEIAPRYYPALSLLVEINK
jgi:tetratricopeptide (TPR) repeat protein